MRRIEIASARLTWLAKRASWVESSKSATTPAPTLHAREPRKSPNYQNPLPFFAFSAPLRIVY